MCNGVLFSECKDTVFYLHNQTFEVIILLKKVSDTSSRLVYVSLLRLIDIPKINSFVFISVLLMDVFLLLSFLFFSHIALYSISLQKANQ